MIAILKRFCSSWLLPLLFGFAAGAAVFAPINLL